ncbi:MAG: IPTL-CTERM sorting domain-containing protein [Burkholderiaceae bacterium]
MSGLFSGIGMRTVWDLRSSRVRWGAVLGFVVALLLPSVALALPNFTIAPTTLNFGNVAVGATSDLVVTVTNVSGVSQTLSSLAGGAPADGVNFGAVQNCAGITLAAGASCVFTYTFHPTSTGAKSTTTSFSVNGESSGTINLSGTGVPAFTIAPTTLNFGNVAVGATSDLVVTVTNVSGASQTLSSLAGGAPADGVNFGAVQNCAGITLAAGASCVLTYTFHPTSTGTKTTTTSFSVNGQSSGTINLNGVGIPAFTAAPTSLDFGVVTVGGTSSGIDVVVTNVSGASQVLSSVAGGAPADAANFGAVQNCAGITLAAGASCAFTYVFHPTTAGLLTSSTSFSINGQAFSISLRGGVPVVAPAGVTSVPTLGQWSLMLLSLLGAAMGALVVGRGRAGVRR